MAGLVGAAGLSDLLVKCLISRPGGSELKVAMAEAALRKPSDGRIELGLTASYTAARACWEPNGPISRYGKVRRYLARPTPHGTCNHIADKRRECRCRQLSGLLFQALAVPRCS